MAAPKGIMAILAGPKKSGADDETETDEAAPESSETGGGSVGERAAQDAIDAIEAKDAAALYEAMERVVAACHAGGEE